VSFRAGITGRPPEARRVDFCKRWSPPGGAGSAFSIPDLSRNCAPPYSKSLSALLPNHSVHAVVGTVFRSRCCCSIHAAQWRRCHSPRILIGKAAPFSPAACEVRLPQGLRFTDVRRSTIGDFPLARGGSRAPKSHGCCGLYPPSQFLPSLRLSAAAPLPRANLRCLLDGIPGPKRPFVRSLRRFPQFSSAHFKPLRSCLPHLPAGAAAVCARCGLRPISGPDERGNPCTEIRWIASSVPGARSDAGCGYRTVGF